MVVVMVGGAAACSRSSDHSTHRPQRTKSAGQGKSVESLKTEDWRAADNTITTWFTDSKSKEDSGFESDNTTLHIGKDTDGNNIVSLLRLPLKATWTVDEVKDARLFLRVVEGRAPAFVNARLVAKTWDDNEQADKLFDAKDGADVKRLEVRAEPDGWISVPVTAQVKAWMGGAAQNNGLAVFGASDKEEFVVASGYAEREDDIPYLKVSGATGQRKSTYGKFGYVESAAPDALADESDNCLSYALRDKDMILISDLDADFAEMNKIYTASGEDAIADYVAKSVEKYVDAHKEKLHISGFHRIDDFNSKIDSQKEYRIALRVGSKPIDGVMDFSENGQFDYHFWTQLNDGRWAQKFPLANSEVIPYTGPGVSPQKYYWDSAPQWLPKFKNFYTSKVVYFAVSKDTDEFTAHKSAG
jgi:hypothetical protein